MSDLLQKKNLADRLRRRHNGIFHKNDIIEIADDDSGTKTTSRSVEMIDLTGDCPNSRDVDVDAERLADFRKRMIQIFRKYKMEAMSLMRLPRRINLDVKDKFSRIEIDSAIKLMDKANDIVIVNGMVRLIVEN